MTNEWTNAEHAKAYLARLKNIPHRAEGESTLLSEISPDSNRVLDLGCGNGHLLDLVLAHCPRATGVGLDFSPTMLDQAQRRFEGNERVTVITHNMDEPLPELGNFDSIVSSFAIHHCTDDRKRAIYAEVFSQLKPGGVFCNLEHVSSPTARIHADFLAELDTAADEEDPSNKLLDVETQLRWLREIGFADVDCYWKWRELALLVGRKPVPATGSQINDSSIDDAPTPMEVAFLDEQLEAFNAEQVGRSDFRPLSVVIRDQAGTVIAGLKAQTGWDWLYVQVLWVAAGYRRAGMGSRLLARAEHRARQRGCIGACLSSFTFQAPQFYERHGYEACGQIDGYPDLATLYFLSKRF